MATPFRASRLFLLACLIVVLSLLLLILSPFLTPLVLATVLAALFHPAHRKLGRAFGNRRSLAAFALCIVITFLIVLPISLLVFTLAAESQQALVDYQQSMESGGLTIAGSEGLLRFWEKISRIPGVPKADFASSAQTAVQETALFLVRNSSTILAGVATMVADFFIMIFTLFFLLRDGEHFLNNLLELMPLSGTQKRRMLTRLKETIVATFLGSFATAAAQGFATGMILWMLGFQKAFLWGTSAALTSLIPVVGTALVWVPASVYLVLHGAWGRALVLLAYGTLVVSTIDNILRPLLIRRTSESMHTLLIFFGILGGMTIFGFSGFILGPLIVAFTLTIADMVKLDFKEGSAP